VFIPLSVDISMHYAGVGERGSAA